MSDSSSKQVSVKDIWPQERDFITRPDRLKYVRRLKNPDDCVFCVSAKKGPSLESLVVFKAPEFQILLNKFPYNNGHLIVAPCKHIASLFELSDQEYLELMKGIRYAGKLVEKAYGVQGMNIGINHGHVAGAGIPEHLHWHVIPRWFGDTNFFPVIAETKVLAETLEQSWERVKNVVDQEEF